jgi:hypothetical protein
MTNITAFIGEPLNFKDKIWIYPPKIKEVVAHPRFSIFQRILTITEEEIRDELEKEGRENQFFPTPFEFLLGNCYNSKDFRALTIEAFEYFCHTKVAFLYEEKKIIIGDVGQMVEEGFEASEIKYLLEEEYFDF